MKYIFIVSFIFSINYASAGDKASYYKCKSKRTNGFSATVEVRISEKDSAYFTGKVWADFKTGESLRASADGEYRELIWESPSQGHIVVADGSSPDHYFAMPHVRYWSTSYSRLRRSLIEAKILSKESSFEGRLYPIRVLGALPKNITGNFFLLDIHKTRKKHIRLHYIYTSKSSKLGGIGIEKRTVSGRCVRTKLVK